jgi:hypothetical protein
MDRVRFLVWVGSGGLGRVPIGAATFGALGFRGFVTLLVFTTATGNPRTLFMRSAKRYYESPRSGRLQPRQR